MYTGGTALLTETYAPSEKARTQGAERLHRVRDDGRVVARVGRARHDERMGDDEPRARCRCSASSRAGVLWLMWLRRQAPAAA